MSKIVFFPNNQFHRNLFLAVGENLKNSIGWNYHILVELDKRGSSNTTFYEELILERWDQIDSSFPALWGLYEKYPEAEFTRALIAEREINYFPEYFGDERVDFKYQLTYLVACVEVFEEFVNEHKPDVIVSEMLTGLADSALKAVCNSNSIKFLSMRSSKMTEGIIVSDRDFDMPVGFEDRVEKLRDQGVPADLEKRAKAHIEEIRSEYSRPHYMEITQKPFRLISMKRLRTMIKRLTTERIATNAISLFQHPIYNPYRGALRKWNNIRVTKNNKNNWFEEHVSEQAYFVYPIHYEPEASSSIRAYNFSDQLGVIKMISRVLPLGVRLVVKEHKGNQGYRNTDFYKALYYVPNVVLVSGDYPVHSLIKNSLGIITLTSRMGWESLLLNKPVAALGDTFWTMAPGVVRIDGWKDIKNFVERVSREFYESDQMKEPTLGKSQDELDSKELILFAAAYISLTLPGKFVLGAPDLYSELNVKRVSDAIFDHCQD